MGRVKDRRRGWPRWLCACDCGVQKEIDSNVLRQGDTLSCGCYRSEMKSRMIREIRTTHGRSRSSIYSIWCKMRERCKNPKESSFSRYGGRGISVCERWDSSFENFLSDVGERPKGKTLDRIDNSGNYEPSNCRWATPKEQAWNTRRNRYFEADGETLILSEWAKRLGTSTDTIDLRLKAGWPVEQALTHPIIRGLKRKGIYSR